MMTMMISFTLLITLVNTLLLVALIRLQVRGQEYNMLKRFYEEIRN